MIVRPSPKDLGFRMPAEWFPHKCCWMAWPCHAATWRLIGLDRARRGYAEIARAIARFEPVKMLVNPEDLQGARELCGMDIELVSFPLSDSWTRDTGPSFLLGCDGALAGVHWLFNAWGGNYDDCELDKKIAPYVIALQNARYFHADVIMEGGSFHVDGEGTILTTRECLLNKNRNPGLSQEQIEQYLCEYLGGDKVIWLNQGIVGDETDGHVDEIATFVAPGKVLCLVTSDENDQNYLRYQENLAILKEATDAKGSRLEVFTVEQPPATWCEGQRLTLSYVNFYLANKGIVMPAFGHPYYDRAAFDLFSELYKDHTITQINALDIFKGGGGIHCITQQQPALI